MNSNPRNSLDYQGAQLEQLSDVSLLEVMQEKTDEETSTKYVLIKHDFYSSDSDHGRELLSGFLDGLSESSFSSVVVYLIDKGTKLLDKEEYIQSTLWKLDKYIRAGIYPNRDLLLTVEEPNTGLDMEKLNQMIDCFFF